MTFETKYFYSQDGARWSDLQPVDPETATRCTRIKGQLSGDAAKNFEIEEKDPHAPLETADGEEEPKPLLFQIPELSVLRYRVDSITAATSVIPTVSHGRPSRWETAGAGVALLTLLLRQLLRWATKVSTADKLTQVTLGAWHRLLGFSVASLEWGLLRAVGDCV